MPKVFICYRRQDTSYVTTMIYEFLRTRFGRKNIFMDVDTIPPGADFRQCLREAVGRADAVLVVIGPEWLVDRHGKRRLDNPRDFVRIEVEAALQGDVRVIPILLRDAAMPSPNDLPESICHLSFRNAVHVRPGRDFRGDMRRLIRALEFPPTHIGTPPLVQDEPDTLPVLPVISHPQAEPDVPLWKPLTPQMPKVITNSIGMQLVLIQPGEFMMGSPNSDSSAESDEKPQHEVRITKPFYLDKYQVTQEQWQAVMGGNPSMFEGPKNPVEQVSWHECQVFLDKLNEKYGGAGGEFRLPTEAQWEYACRAGSKTRFSFGDDEERLVEYAWYESNSGGTTHPVGKKEPNAWGLYDMHGNVWEWCADWYDPGYYARSSADDPTGSEGGSGRVHRGGGWGYAGGRCRSAYRGSDGPGYRDGLLGLRVSRVVAE